MRIRLRGWSQNDDGTMRLKDILSRLAAEDIILSNPPAPSAHYQAWSASADMLFISGQVSATASQSILGIVGTDLDLATARRGARLCAVNLLAQANAALDGRLERIRQIRKITGFVQVGESFFDIPNVIDGCSNLLVRVLGNRGAHARTSVGVLRLPRNHAVEIDAFIEIE